MPPSSLFTAGEAAGRHWQEQELELEPEPQGLGFTGPGRMRVGS